MDLFFIAALAGVPAFTLALALFAAWREGCRHDPLEKPMPFQFTQPTLDLLQKYSDSVDGQKSAHADDAAADSQLAAAQAHKGDTAAASSAADQKAGQDFDAALTAVTAELRQLSGFLPAPPTGTDSGGTPAAASAHMMSRGQYEAVASGDLGPMPYAALEQMTVRKHSVNAVERAKALSRAKGLSYTTILNAVLTYGPGVTAAIEQFGLPLLNDLGKLSFKELVSKYGQQLIDSLAG